ncbi:NUDIX hydrolase [Wenzhouxiangella sp. AB-CW3]|uniref:NUDIX hydrolase n=1 Tax=Wenzhouxiangella sp. AB-CW3 TaxID=2771012 RepID=UPI00168A740F|nr:NUDIX domain-containing protein [Wenzhouxiangella sp. AB-CW3]QOC22237.1 NUDIX hydrolase [Wenzhouxiangella sp. AB-CW3]
MSFSPTKVLLTTDIVLFTIQQERLKVLLVRRASEPYKGSWALPGGFVQEGESLAECARRELLEETGVDEAYLEQLYTFGDPDRDPRGRVVTVAYFALVRSDELILEAATDADAAAWFPVDELPDLAFDHAEILQVARERLSAKVEYSTIAFQLLPEEFTLRQAQGVHEAVLGHSLDKRNFRAALKARGLVKGTGRKFQDGPHRPAELFRLVSDEPVQIIK